MISPRYRSDIDGLRAIAVLGVVIYHAFPMVLPGGFIGVDIFFVISGYLISGILYRGHREGNFSYGEFYARRIRRLFPALITMLVLCLAYGWLVLLADEYEQLGRHVAAGTVFAQNFSFWKESGYFDNAAELKPMLHLWSLAVEEQFYIVFPLLLVLLWKKPKLLLPAIVSLLIASFLGNMVMSRQNPETDFYLTPYRGWEFLGGGLLAWWHDDRGREETVPKRREAMSWAGLLFLGVGMALLDKHHPYPGWRALLPVVGTLLLIEGGKGAWLNRVVLSHPAIVWIGLVSYPLYLFHWPALSFLHIVKGQQPPALMIWAALGTALLLTLITYYGIEKRIRHHASRMTIPMLVTAFLVTGAIGMLVSMGLLKPRSSGMGFEKNAQASRENNYFDGYKSIPTPSNYTRYAYGNQQLRTLFIGDSHMEQCAPRIREVIDEGRSDGRGALFLTRGGFLPIYGIVNTQKPGDAGFPRDLFEKTLDDSIDRIVIDANWCYYFNWGGRIHRSHGHALNSVEGIGTALGDLESFLDDLRRRGKKTFLILNIPGGFEFDPKTMIKRGFDGCMSITACNLTSTDFLNIRGLMPFTQGELMRRLRELAERTGTKVMDPMPVLAPDGFCLRFEGGKPVYHDLAHLTSSFVRTRAVYLDPAVEP